MACGELGPDNIAQVKRETGLAEFHFAALKAEPSAMQHRNVAVGMGGTALDREYTNTVADPARIRATIAARARSRRPAGCRLPCHTRS